MMLAAKLNLMPEHSAIFSGQLLKFIESKMYVCFVHSLYLLSREWKPWIERIGDLAAKTGLPLHAGTTSQAPGK